MTPLERANAQQLAASDPNVSAFVSASAGSGKTKLLTDRLLRLMLTGTPPARILCLTYTRAAAAEMAIRLNRRLGQWVLMEESALRDALRDLDVPATAKALSLALQLFADVLDLPGGMRIGTIHAFCQSLLRRFPLEAGLSPHFELADDAGAAERLREARETVLADPAQRDAIAALAAETSEQEFAGQTARFADGKNDFQQLLNNHTVADIRDMQAEILGAHGLHEAGFLARAVRGVDEANLHAAFRRLAALGTQSGQTWAAEALAWLEKTLEERAAQWSSWISVKLIASGAPRSLNKFYGKNLAAEQERLHQHFTAEQSRVAEIEEKRKAECLAALNAQLTSLMVQVLQAENATKSLQARLTYADLITRTGRLMKKPGTEWILYKLDGGIDHLLLDEVQDTAPAQWEIAYAIAEEFFAGASARDVRRSIFAVGDEKQSIFSFQGADLQSFRTYREKFKTRIIGAGQRFLDGTLSISFRSTAAVLTLVDAVFAAGPARDGVVAAGAMLEHGVSRAGQAGSVTLWPLTQPVPVPAAPDWDVPDDYASATSAKTALAQSIAAQIKTWLTTKKFLSSRDRAITPGDILILVRRRDELVAAITGACKSEKIPIAGLDRMVLKDQLAVSDLIALCDALLLPEDDMAFGQFLASPLGGLSDDSIMHLALNRRGTLAAALFARREEREDWAAAQRFFETLRSRTDYITPHALLAEILFTLGGRAKLLQRLGAEAAEPIDEFLAEALNYGRREPASLQAFLHHMRQSAADIKREAESGGGLVRIMTVHGAKGLQAPVVILPDTTGLPNTDEKLFWLTTAQQPDIAVPVFCPRAGLRSKTITQAHEARKIAQLAEYNRLLYVALTRAEDEILVCGAAPKKALNAACWYESIKAGFTRLPHQISADGSLLYATPQLSEPDRVQKAAAAAAPGALPSWAGAAPDWVAIPPALEATRPEPLAPSRAAEESAKRAIAASPLSAPQARSTRAAALAKGRAVHALLQHLPDCPPPTRRAAGLKYLAGNQGLDASILDSVLGIIENPALAALFGPLSRAEVPLAGVIAGAEIGGLVDRLAVSNGEILLADYKTDRTPPATAAAIPPGYLAQLAAYTAILAQIYPVQNISCLLIFTQTATVIPVPPALLTRHAPRRPADA